MQWKNSTPPGTIPLDLKGYAKDGKCVLVWRDVIGNQNELMGYFVYRKEASMLPTMALKTTDDLMKNGFKKLNEKLIPAAAFTDVNVKEGDSYVYAITAANMDNIEGASSAAILLKLALAPIYAPSGIAVRTTSAGMVIDWGKSLQENVDGYEVLRRAENEKEATVLGKVPSGSDNFTDKNAIAGKTYFYSVGTTDSNDKSERSDEVSVRP